MTVLGEIYAIVTIGDTKITIPFSVIESLSLPLILGKPFMHQTGARMDFELVSTFRGDTRINHIEGTLHMRDSIIGVVMSPIKPPTITFHTHTTTLIPPNTETLISCTASSELPTYVEWPEYPEEKHDWQILEVQRSDTIYKSQSLIVKPSTVFRQEDGTYRLSVINPLSIAVKLEHGIYLTEGTIKRKPYFRKIGEKPELPESIVLGPDPACDAPADAPCRTQAESINSIQVLWPERPYCPPVTIGEETLWDREVGCQVEVDVGNQTRVQTFQPIIWEDILELEDHALPYKADLLTILHSHREAFAVDLTELAVVEDVFYRIDLRADAMAVNKRAYKMSPLHEEELDRQLEKLESAGIIQPAQSMWGVPAFIVYRRDNEGNPIKPRLVCDFSYINEMIVPSKSPIPTIPDIIDQLAAGQNKFFSILDIHSAFYAIQLADESRDICAINTRKQKYRFNRLCMGIRQGG